MSKSLLVFGRGFLGDYLVEEAQSQNFKTAWTNFAQSLSGTHKVDITDVKEVEKTITRVNPDYVINCAARGDIDFLQNHRELAMAVNAEGPSNIAKICNENSIRMIHISTDAVFDGIKGNYTEDDIPNPLNVYSESKLLGENKVSKIGRNYVIVRTNFYGIDKKGVYFFSWIINSLKSNKKITGFTDVIFSPLDVFTLSKMLLELLEIRYSGILHLSSGKPISKHDFIMLVADMLGFSKTNINAGKLSDASLIAPRPKNTSLRNDRARTLLKTQVVDIKDWLEQNKLQIKI